MIGEKVLLVFCKYPEEGKVKTRLAKTIGNKKAAEIYKVFVEHILKSVDSDAYETVVFVSEQARVGDVNDWLGEDVNVLPQSGNDLGERMYNAFKAAFIMGASKVIVIGTDYPLLTRSQMESSFELLETCECIIGPSEDGGYYLLGMKEAHARLFENMEWGSTIVFEKTKEKMASLGLACEVLEKGLDVDEEKDLKTLCEGLKEGELLRRIREIYKF